MPFLAGEDALGDLAVLGSHLDTQDHQEALDSSNNLILLLFDAQNHHARGFVFWPEPGKFQVCPT